MSNSSLTLRAMCCAAVLGAVGAAGVHAQTPVPAPVMPPSASAGAQGEPALPAMQDAGSVRYRCGGIGSDESTAMRAAMASHPLSLLFARADGAYLADVQVEVRGSEGSGAPAQWRASGPVCLLQLPPGRYTVAASLDGQQRSQTVQVGAGPRTLDFRF